MRLPQYIEVFTIYARSRMLKMIHQRMRRHHHHLETVRRFVVRNQPGSTKRELRGCGHLAMEGGFTVTLTEALKGKVDAIYLTGEDVTFLCEAVDETRFAVRAIDAITSKSLSLALQRQRMECRPIAIYATVAGRQREALKNLVAARKANKAIAAICAIIDSWYARLVGENDAKEEIFNRCEEILSTADIWEAPEELLPKFHQNLPTPAFHPLAAGHFPRFLDTVVLTVSEQKRVVAMLRSCCSWLFFLLKLVLFIWISLVAKDWDLWHFMTQYPVGCAHDALPENQSGIKVLILGLAKSGTRTICHALNELGVRAYHSEDFHFLPWWDLVHELREEKGHYANLTQPYIARELHTDEQLRSRLMQKISKCRMEAVALDGLELLMEPLAKANPTAKVIMLNWRTFPQWRKSLDVFTIKLIVMVFHNVISGSSLGLLPWLALLRPLDRLISGDVVEHVLRSGGPPITEVSGPLVWLYHQSMNHRRQYECWQEPTTTVDPKSEEEFRSFYEKVDEYFPKEQVFEWDPRKNTLEELCQFLEISPCPKKGKVPKAINTWIFERDFPIAANAVIVLRIFLHWVNWKLLGALLSFLSFPNGNEQLKSSQLSSCPFSLKPAKFFTVPIPSRSRGCLRRRAGCVKGFTGRSPWRFLRFAATLLVQAVRLVIFALLILPACLHIGLSYFRSPHIARAVRYGQRPRQLLDIYYPAEASSGRVPVVITVMGGAWMIGHRLWNVLLAWRLASSGVMVMAVDYRSLPANHMKVTETPRVSK
eukprot:symbB.v1.2.007009.t3/scaffold385.1/size305797/5